MKHDVLITLPEDLGAWVREQAAAQGYQSPSQFLEDLIRAERRRRLRDQVDDNLHAALDSGEPTPLTPETWERIRREGRKRLNGKRKTP